MEASPTNSWKRIIPKWCFWTGGLLILLVLVSIFSLSIGSTSISLTSLAQILYSRFWALETKGVASTIIFQIRLPRLILGLFVGGALAVAGVIFQGLFQNPLVEPYTLGVSGGAALGVCLFVVLNCLQAAYLRYGKVPPASFRLVFYGMLLFFLAQVLTAFEHLELHLMWVDVLVVAIFLISQLMIFRGLKNENGNNSGIFHSV